MFETERCLIVPFQQSDTQDVKNLYLDPEVRKYLGGIRPYDSIKVQLDVMLNSSKDSYYWVVREKYTADFIGLVSLDPHHEGMFKEISYQFLPSQWRQGYATEIVSVIIHFALNELNLSTVVAETQIANKPSCKLLEKLGMKLERTVFRFGTEQAIYSIRSSK